MIESQTIAGPIAVARSFATPPAAELAPPPKTDPFSRPDPGAPFGPAPTFRVTYLERVWETLEWPGPRPPEAAQPFAGPTPRPDDAPAMDLRA